MRVLVVDDDDDVRESTLMLLEALGHDAVGVAAARDAVETARRHRPDVLLQDMNMPGLDPLPFLASLPEELPGVAVVAFTASASLQDMKGAPGVAGVLAKPFGVEDLERALEAARPRRAGDAGRHPTGL